MIGRQMSRKLMLPVVLGLCDGILTTLVLAAGRLTDVAQPMTLGFAIRIALVAFLSGAFVFYVARYADLRYELIHAARQLNMSAYGKLANSALGRAVQKEAITAAVASSGAAFAGALVPLLAAALVPQFQWTSITVSLIALAILAAALARAVRGAVAQWIAGLVLGGVCLTLLGLCLKVVA